MANKINYPYRPDDAFRGQHASLALQLQQGNLNFAEDWLQSVVDESIENGSHTVFLSSEEFSPLFSNRKIGIMLDFKQILLRYFDEVLLVVVLRQLNDWIYSSIREHIKSGLFSFYDVEKYRHQAVIPRIVVSNAEQRIVDAKTRMSVLSFDELKRGAKLVENFFASVFGDIGITSGKGYANKSTDDIVKDLLTGFFRAGLTAKNGVNPYLQDVAGFSGKLDALEMTGSKYPVYEDVNKSLDEVIKQFSRIVYESVVDGYQDFKYAKFLIK
ncbi:MAG: hypothetical protein R3F42_06670 [Pseudomonadota bacterium]